MNRLTYFFYNLRTGEAIYFKAMNRRDAWILLLNKYGRGERLNWMLTNVQ